MYSSIEPAHPSILYNNTPSRRKRSDSESSSTSFASFSTSPTISKIPLVAEKRPPLMERKAQDDDTSWVQKAHELLSSLVTKTKEERTAASRTLIFYINNIKNSKDRKIIYFRKKLLDITYFNTLLNSALVSVPSVSVQQQGSQNTSSLMTAAEISSPYLSDSDDEGVIDSVYIDHSNDVFERDSPEKEPVTARNDSQIDDIEREKTIGMIIKYFEEFDEIAKSEEFMDPYFCDQCRYIVTNEFLNYWIGERNLNLEQKLLVLPAFYKMFSENIALLMEDNIGMIDSCKSLMQELAIQLFYLILKNDIREYLSEVLGMIHDIIEKLVSMKIAFPHFYLHFFSYYLKNFSMANFNTKAYIDRVNKYLSLVYRFPESEEKEILVEFLQLCLLIRTNQVEEVKKKMKQSTTAAVSYHVHPIFCLLYAEALYEICFFHGGVDLESIVLKCYNSYRSYLSCLKENQYLQQMVFLKEEDFSTPFPVFNLAKFLKIALKRIELNIGGNSKTAVVVNEVKYFSQVAGKYVEKKKNSLLTSEMEIIEKKLREYEIEYNKSKTEESNFKRELMTGVQSVGIRWDVFEPWCKKNSQQYDTAVLKYDKLKESREYVMIQFIQSYCEDQVTAIALQTPQNQDLNQETHTLSNNNALELNLELLKLIGFNTPIAESIYRRVNSQSHVMKLQPALFWIHQWIKNCLRTATEYENLFFEGLEMDQIITLYSKAKEFKALQIFLEELNMTHIFMLHKTTLGETSKTSTKYNANYYYLVVSWYEAISTITNGFNLQNGIKWNDFSTQPVIVLVNNLATAKDLCHYYNCFDNTKAAILIFTLPNSFDKYDQIKANHSNLVTKENHLWEQVVANTRRNVRHYLEEKHSIEGNMCQNPLEVNSDAEQPRKSTAIQLCILQLFSPIVEYLESHFVGCLFVEHKAQ